MPGNPGAPVPLPPSRFPFWGGSQGPISYLQAAAPTNIPPGTLWIDSASGSGRTYRWNGLGFDDTGIGQLPSGFLTGVTGTVNQVVASANVGGVVTLSLAPDVSGINSLTTAAGLFSNGATLTRADGGYQLELASASRTYGFAISGTTFLLDDLTGGTRLSFTSAGILGLGAPYQAATGILTNAVSTGAVTSATVGSSLSLSGGSLNTIQDLRTTASPTFAGLTVTTPTFAGWTFNAGPSPAFIQAPSGAQIQDNGGQINIVANHANQGVSLVTQMGGAVNLSIAGTPGLTVSSARLIALPAYTTAGPLTNDASGNISSIASGGNGTFLGVSGGVLGFFTPAGSGTINSGTSGQLTYYAATGTAVSGAAGTSITGQGSLVLSNSTNTSLASLSVQNNQQAAITLDSFGSTASGTIAGFNKAGAVALIAGPGGATSPTALVIETFNNQPVIFGVNDIEVGRFISTTFALPSTLTGGLQVHNQTDEVTNYERLEALWSTNVAIIRTVQGGTGSNRSLQLSTSAGGDAFTIATGQNGSGVFQFSAVGGSFATASALGIVSGTAWTQASGQQNFVTVRPTYNQSASTAANTDLLINRTQTAVGSGAQLLIDAQVSTVSKWKADNTGNVVQTGSLTLSQTGGIVGTTTNNNANSGSVGEYVSSTVSSSPGVSLTNNTPTNISSISLTAGDWDVQCSLFYAPAATTTTAALGVAASLVSATLPGSSDGEAFYTLPFTTGQPSVLPAPTLRVLVAVTTTVYLIGFANFGVSTAVAGGTIRARRMR